MPDSEPTPPAEPSPFELLLYPDAPEAADGPPVPVRMLNEFTYCPRLGYLEWVQGEWAESADTLHGEFVHRNVDRPDQRAVPAGDAAATDTIHARSLRLEDAALGLVAVVDVIEVEGNVATPVDYKRGRTPDLPGEAWEPDRVQLCAQGLLLRAAGFQCTAGVVYYAASKQRVTVDFDDALVGRTRELIVAFRRTAAAGIIPPPLVDSPKCPRCSLVSICLPDETRLLAERGASTAVAPADDMPPQPHAWDGSPEPSEAMIAPADEAPPQPGRPVRLALVPRADSRPLHVVEQGARVGKSGDRLEIDLKGKKLASVKLIDVSQVCLYGNIQVTTQALGELIDRGIPICYFSSGGWFRGMSTGFVHRNVEVRIRQYAAAADPAVALPVARAFIGGKIRNSRTLLRRNLDGDPDRVVDRLAELATDAERAASAATLLGIEGMAAKVYFSAFGRLLKEGFDFEGRNRRPPLDPVNAALSFLYAVLTREVHVAVQAAGLDPMLGLLHQPRYGRPSLALDLAEEFRPLLADSVALSALNTGELAVDHFVRRAGACGLTPPGKRAVLAAWERRLSTEVTHPVFGYVVSYRRVVAVQARLLARTLAGEIPAYTPFKTR